MNAVRWGIIGAGNVCEVKSAPAMQRVPGSGIVAVMRRERPNGSGFTLRRHGISRWYSRAEDWLADSEVNGSLHRNAAVFPCGIKPGWQPGQGTRFMLKKTHGPHLSRFLRGRCQKTAVRYSAMILNDLHTFNNPSFEAIVQDLHAGTNACVKVPEFQLPGPTGVMEWITAS